MAASILVVEDNHANIELTDFLLRAFGYEPLLALSGVDGVRLAAEHRPDLILMDIQMPGMDGYEATAEIKKRPELRTCPIVAVTAFAMVGDQDRIMSSGGFAGYISKPISPETFVTQVEAFLPAAMRVAGPAANGE